MAELTGGLASVGRVSLFGELWGSSVPRCTSFLPGGRSLMAAYLFIHALASVICVLLVKVLY